MARTTLSEAEIQELIAKYESELSKLEYQKEAVSKAIYDLYELKGSIKNKAAKVATPESITIEAPAKKKPGRPPKAKNTTAKEVAPKAAPKAKKAVEAPVAEEGDKKGYKLSAWDEIIITGIKAHDKGMLTSDIINLVKEEAGKQGLPNDDENVKNKVTRSLQKLVNRRGDLAKAKYKGRGFAYALPEWVSKRGNLIKGK